MLRPDSECSRFGKFFFSDHLRGKTNVLSGDQPSMDTVAVRTQVLEACGASPAEQEELLAYNQNLFDGGATPVDGGQFTLVDEPHVKVWRNYLHLARQLGVYPALALALVQLQFPIQAGISTTENYRLATRKGQLPPPGLRFRRTHCRLLRHSGRPGPLPGRLVSAICGARTVPPLSPQGTTASVSGRAPPL